MATKTTEVRRSQAEPIEEAQEAVTGADGSLKRAAMTAAAAAIAGGLAGAAQELLSRRGDRDEAPADEDEEPQAEAAEQEQPEEDEGDDPSAEAEVDETAEPDEDEAEDGDEPEEDEDGEADAYVDDEPRAAADEPAGEADEEPEQGDAPRDGAEPGRAVQIVRAARREVEELIGSAPESVSGLRRTKDGWAVTVEVVEVHRIPETTDVLSSYEITVDDDGKLLDFERKRRYRRSQVDDG